MKAWDIERELDNWATAQGFSPEDPHYIVGEFNLKTPDGEIIYSDEAHLWCADCARAILESAMPLLPKDEREDHFVCSADVAGGADSPSRCMKCGKDLDHCLTENGVASELDHYREHPVTDISPVEAWCIARLLESAPDDGETIDIGNAALAAIRDGKVRPAARALVKEGETR